jgi:hypothetical protein
LSWKCCEVFICSKVAMAETPARACSGAQQDHLSAARRPDTGSPVAREKPSRIRRATFQAVYSRSASPATMLTARRLPLCVASRGPAQPVLMRGRINGHQSTLFQQSGKSAVGINGGGASALVGHHSLVTSERSRARLYTIKDDKSVRHVFITRFTCPQ